MEWVTNLYTETKELWKQKGKDPKGFAIFYSPVILNPTVAIIGFNPGGDENSFSEKNITVPIQNEYLTAEYPMAKKVRKIFEAGDIMWALEDSVKFNLIFFRSKNEKDINDKKIIQFCEQKVLEILKEIKPKYIITEGFKTYERLKKLLRANGERTISEDRKAILCISKTKENVPLLGMIHPTGAHGISDEILGHIGMELKSIIKR